MIKYLTITLLLFPFLLSSQTIEISGQVKDAGSRENLEFCTVLAINDSGMTVKGTVTDKKGFYSMEIVPGRYRIVCSFIGYTSDTSKSQVYTQRTFTGITQLTPDVNYLKEVNVKTSASEVQLDRDVQIVTDKMKEGASTTKEVLEKVNGVTYDRYNNSVKVDNDSKIIILVDGIEKDQEYVKNLAPERLKKIEVIRDPGGRYGLEGYSAVINVILKKDYRGTEIFATGRSMLDTDVPGLSQVLVQSGNSLTYNYVYNKVNTYVKAGTDINRFHLKSKVIKTYGDSMQILSLPADDSHNNLLVKQLFNNYTAGSDVFLNPKNTISLEAGMRHQPIRYDNTTLNDHVTIINNQVTQDSYISDVINKSGNQSFYTTLFYEWKPGEKNTITTNFSWNHSFTEYNSSYHTVIGSITGNRIEEGSTTGNGTKTYAEFTHTFNQKQNFQGGYGNTWQKNESKFMSFNPDIMTKSPFDGSAFTRSSFAPQSATEFTYSDFRHKLYGYYSLQATKKLGIKAGAAGETSNPAAGDQKNTYYSIQPYFDIRYKPINMISIKGKYRSAARYPESSETNPFTYMVDQQTIKTGNPLLKPSVTHKLSVQLALFEGLLSVEPYYHFAGNMIAETGRLRDDGLFEYSYDNLGRYENKGIEAHLTIPFGKSLFLQSDADFYKSSVNYAGKEHKLSDVAMTQQLVYVHQKSNTVAGFQYQNNLRKFITAQGYQMGDNDFWIVFVQKPFFQQRLSVMALYFLPVSWGCEFNQGGYISSSGYTELKQYDISMLKNMLMFEVSYRFNKGKSVTKVEKKKEEEQTEKPKKLF